VTGASRGLGRGVEVELAARGFSVAINYSHNQKAAMETVSRCEALRPDRFQRFVPLAGNIALTSDREELVSQTIKEFGRIDALINNAGIAPKHRKDLTEMSEDSYNEVMETNLKGPMFLTQLVANYWLKKRPRPLLRGGFKIVFISSISAVAASLNRGEYCISKAGLSMVNKLWAVRLAEERVQVYDVRPGVMATDMTIAVKEKYDKQFAEGLVPMKRWGTSEDVGHAVASLVTGDFPFSTGEVIYVDGGLHIQRL
jgi:NAD(P)-dependent dehydrogenase (short-subunit alcohol dehydrogenase family)